MKEAETGVLEYLLSIDVASMVFGQKVNGALQGAPPTAQLCIIYSCMR